MERPALALLTTGGLTPVRAEFELLHTPADLAAWLPVCLPGLPGLTAGGHDLADAVGLREALFVTIRRRTSGQPDRDRDLQVINSIAGRPALSPAISLAGGGRTWFPAAAAAALSTIAWDGIDLLAGDLAGRVRECASPHCELVFIDISPPGTRRWCAMGRCGNRAKNQQYRRRTRSVSRVPADQLPEHVTVPR
jgi:predicted RNA-binding Zn ribbon-like protein